MKWQKIPFFFWIKKDYIYLSNCHIEWPYRITEFTRRTIRGYLTLCVRWEWCTRCQRLTCGREQGSLGICVKKRASFFGFCLGHGEEGKILFLESSGIDENAWWTVWNHLNAFHFLGRRLFGVQDVLFFGPPKGTRLWIYNIKLQKKNMERRSRRSYAEDSLWLFNLNPLILLPFPQSF